jgi:hypothetical protein
MLGCIGKRQPDTDGQGIDPAFTLTEMLQQFQPVGVPQGARDTGELGKDGLLRAH